jgi:hypothetical protein
VPDPPPPPQAELRCCQWLPWRVPRAQRVPPLPGQQPLPAQCIAASARGTPTAPFPPSAGRSLPAAAVPPVPAPAQEDAPALLQKVRARTRPAPEREAGGRGSIQAEQGARRGCCGLLPCSHGAVPSAGNRAYRKPSEEASRQEAHQCFVCAVRDAAGAAPAWTTTAEAARAGTAATGEEERPGRAAAAGESS